MLLSPMLAVLLPTALHPTVAQTLPSRGAAQHRRRALVTLRGGELTAEEEVAKQQWLAGVRGSVVPTATSGDPVVEYYAGAPTASSASTAAHAASTMLGGSTSGHGSGSGGGGSTR